MSLHGLLLPAMLAYLGLLSAIALVAERRARLGHSLIDNAWTYGLSLAVYCTAWTYFGSVGRAAQSGIGFLPVYLGPTLGMMLAWLILLKMVRIAKRQRITSIADLIAARYGKSTVLGALVSLVALIGALPYIALQLKAISGGVRLLSVPAGPLALQAPEGNWFADDGLYVALLLGAFTIFFGARHLDASERHEGLVAVVAVESLVKLCAFLAVGIFVSYGLFDGIGDILGQAAADPALNRLLQPPDNHGWLPLTLLSMLSVFLLPRQFQVMVVENVREAHLRRASWLFPAYMLLINVFVLPIALGGLLFFGPAQAEPDSFVLSLPLATGHPVLALFVFIGGFSAATGMIVVETIAIATMCSNNLVLPLLLKKASLVSGNGDLSRLVLGVRRALILLVLLLGYTYFRIAGEAYALVSIGLVSFAAVAQFAPALFGGLFWRGGRRCGAIAGLMTGFALWLYTLVVPALARSGWLDASLLTAGPWHIGWLRPEHLFGLAKPDPITHGLFWSLGFNTLLYVVLSLRHAPNAREAAQAALFVDALQHDGATTPHLWRGDADVAALRALLARCLGTEREAELFQAWATSHAGDIHADSTRADPALVHFIEAQLAGVIGSASAHAMLASLVKEAPLSLAEVLDIVDEASRVHAYSRRLEEKSRALELATTELRAANARLQELDRLKDDFMSSVSHELRTPLTSIRAFSELLRDTPDIADAERQRFLDIIISESERLTRLVNQVLDLARIESGRAEWHTEEIRLKEVAEQACAATSQLLLDKGVRLRVCHSPDGLLPIQGDRDRLVQVVINLLSNAAKAAPAQHGRVILHYLTTDTAAGIAVCDNGPGIPAAETERIFERFHQLGDAATRAAGTGLGLPISRQIIEHSGGRLWAKNRRRHGACFCFLIPTTRHFDGTPARSKDTYNDKGQEGDNDAKENPDRRR